MLDQFCVIDALLRRALVGGACCGHPRGVSTAAASSPSCSSLVIGQLNEGVASRVYRCEYGLLTRRRLDLPAEPPAR